MTTAPPPAPERPLRVCFFSPLLWPVWSGGEVQFAGGAELQQARLARGLAARGFDVTVVTCDFGQPSPTTVHGVRVLKTYRPEDGWPVLRFFHPRITRSVAALRTADADVYYVRCASLEAGLAYDVARSRGAAFVFAAAHDHDALRSLPLLPNPRDRWWQRRALRGAAVVIAQSEVQRGLFRSEWGREATVVRNLVELPPSPADGAGDAVVWVATYKPAKRPEWFIELARALPQHRFVMCGVVPRPPDSTAAWEAARAAGRELPNLEVRGWQDPAQVSELLSGAALFVHTSPVEGFPNTLLEAWAHGVPGVSCVDPDGVVARHGFGEVVADREGLVRAVGGWMASPERRREAGRRARRYAEEAHAPEAAVSGLARVLEQAGRAARAQRGTSPARRPVLTRFFRLAFGLAGATAMVVALASTWDRAHQAILPPWSAFAWALAGVAAGIAGVGRGWAALFDRRHAPRLRAAFYAAQFGKYLPGGGLWQAVGQAEMSRGDGLSATRAAAGFLVHAVIQLSAGLVAGSLVALDPSRPPGVRALLGSAILAVVLLYRGWLVRAVRLAARLVPRFGRDLAVPAQPEILRSFAWTLTAFVGSGFGFAMLLHGLDPTFGLLRSGAAFCLAWAVGYAAVPFPSGLGVREAALAFLLPGATAQVLAASIALRLVQIVSELAFGAIASRRLAR